MVHDTRYLSYVLSVRNAAARIYSGPLRLCREMTLVDLAQSFSPLSLPQYMKDVNCPFKMQERQETVDWLLGLAVRLEYGDNGMTEFI